MNSTTWWSLPTVVYFWNMGDSCGVFDVLFNGHQTFLAGFLKDVVQQGHEFQIPFLGIDGALERLRNHGNGGFENLGLVVDRKGTQGATKNGDELERQGVENHPNVATVKDVNTEDATHGDDITDDNYHVRAEPKMEVATLVGTM